MQKFSLYRIPDPQNHPRAELYQVTIETAATHSTIETYVNDWHGFWDDANKDLVLQRTTFAPEEPYPRIEDANHAAATLIRNRVKDGFRHCFIPATPPDDPPLDRYVLLDPDGPMPLIDQTR
jgi:hypothetical protein